MSVTTGTPIHSASQIVVVPPYGYVSRQMSMAAYCMRCADAVAENSINVKRSGEIPAAPNIAVYLSRTGSSAKCRHLISIRASGTARSTADHMPISSGFIFGGPEKDPKVTWFALRQGNGATSGQLGGGR